MVGWGWRLAPEAACAVVPDGRHDEGYSQELRLRDGAKRTNPNRPLHMQHRQQRAEQSRRQPRQLAHIKSAARVLARGNATLWLKQQAKTVTRRTKNYRVSCVAQANNQKHVPLKTAGAYSIQRILRSAKKLCVL